MSDIAIKASEPLTLRAQLTEDWLAVVIGLLVFGAALVSVSGTDILGWAVTTSVYVDLTQALSPFAKAYAWLGGGGALIATYLALLAMLGEMVGQHALRLVLRQAELTVRKIGKHFLRVVRRAALDDRPASLQPEPGIDHLAHDAHVLPDF